MTEEVEPATDAQVETLRNGIRESRIKNTEEFVVSLTLSILIARIESDRAEIAKLKAEVERLNGELEAAEQHVNIVRDNHAITQARAEAAEERVRGLEDLLAGWRVAWDSGKTREHNAALKALSDAAKAILAARKEGEKK